MLLSVLLLCVSVHSVLLRVCTLSCVCQYIVLCVSNLCVLCQYTLSCVSVHSVLYVSTLCLVVCQYTRPESLLLERDLLGLPSTSTALHANSPHAAAFSFLPAEVCHALLGNWQLSISDRCNKATVHHPSTGTVSKAAMDNPLNTHCSASQCLNTHCCFSQCLNTHCGFSQCLNTHCGFSQCLNTHCGFPSV